MGAGVEVRMENILERYVISQIPSAEDGGGEEEKESSSSPLLLERTDSSILFQCRDGGIRSMPSPRKLQDVASSILYSFKRQQAAAVRGRLMCHCLVVGLRERLGNQRQGALGEVLERHWGEEPRARLMWAREHQEEAHLRIQEVLWTMSLRDQKGLREEWWSEVA